MFSIVDSDDIDDIVYRAESVEAENTPCDVCSMNDIRPTVRCLRERREQFNKLKFATTTKTKQKNAIFDLVVFFFLKASRCIVTTVRFTYL